MVRKFCDALLEGKTGILLGILGFKDGWMVRSNRESGNGFSDIMIRIDDSDTGIIIEVKYDEKGKLEEECRQALRQIDDTGYTEALHQEEVHKILKYDIACRRKDFQVIMEVENQEKKD